MDTRKTEEPHPNLLEANEFLEIRQAAWETAKRTGDLRGFQIATRNVNRFLNTNPIPKVS